jgi:hypothetical protein
MVNEMALMRKNRLLSVLKPISIVLLCISVFTLVWLRSGIVSLEYKISNLEKKKTELIISREILIAERASLLSIERFKNSALSGEKFAFPDRVKVVHVKRTADVEPYRASVVVERR